MRVADLQGTIPKLYILIRWAGELRHPTGTNLQSCATGFGGKKHCRHRGPEVAILRMLYPGILGSSAFLGIAVVLMPALLARLQADIARVRGLGKMKIVYPKQKAPKNRSGTG